MGRATRVTLEVDGRKADFEFTHAERLLRLTKAGWHLPENSKFEFVGNGLRYKSNKGRSSKA